MTFAIKGQTKAAVAFKGNFGVYGLILFKFCIQVAYCLPGKSCYITFTIKGQTKAAVALKGNFAVYGKILLNCALCNKTFRVISYLHAKFEQNWSINAKVTFKGLCGLCLAFDC